MGEWSKKVGEDGEDIVGNLLKMIGWGDAEKGIEFPCNRPRLHGLNGNSKRTTHGIDFLFSYPSPLIDGMADNLVISSKFSATAYPSSPSSSFGRYLLDLATTLNCFGRSYKRSELTKCHSGARKTRDIGVLFWLSNERSSYDDIIDRLADFRPPDETVFESVFVVDNKRASFLYDSILCVRNRYHDADIEFFYPGTGNNLNPETKRNSGSVLPVEYINTSVLPLRVQNRGGGTSLVLSVIDLFEKDHLKRLMGLAQEISANFAAKTIIAFPDFDKLRHGNDVQTAKSAFDDKKFTDRVEVISFNADFRSGQ